MTMAGYSIADLKAGESQMSTTAGYSNTVASSLTRHSDSLGRESSKEALVRPEEEMAMESEKELKILDDAVKRAESIQDIAALKNEAGPTCYPSVYQGQMIIIFDDGPSRPCSEKKSEKIKNEILEEVGSKDQNGDEHMLPTDLEALRDWTFWGYFVKYPDFLRAVKNMFTARLQKVSSTTDHLWYFGLLYSIYLNFLMSEKHSSKFYADQAKEMDIIVNHWKDWKVSCSTYPRIPRCSRQYIEIKSYEPAVVCFNTEIEC